MVVSLFFFVLVECFSLTENIFLTEFLFLSRNARKRRGCAMILLDILEELGRCAALDFAVRCFSFGVFFLTEFTERTEFFYSRTRCLTSSNALDGIHGNAVAAPACYAELVSPTDYTDLKDFLFRFFATFKILFCLGNKNLICNKIRSLTASKSLYGFAQIFFGLATERTHEPCVPR